MEPAYANEFKKTRMDKVWCIGPVSLCNKDAIEKAQRGNKGLVDEQKHLLRWLDSQETGQWISVDGFEERTKGRGLVVRNRSLRVGVEEPMRWAEEEKIGVLVKKEYVKEAIEKLMDEQERRKRAKKLGEMAKKAVEIGGSAHLKITRLIQVIRKKSYDMKQTSS
ncbi:hypothetical protein F3Y22_tig00001120pilonHSYRG00373 [Hibiscus syriacus]|uniref:Uncharacterized protein n=1 Tax=Hibiscus syriacus TaxID=106335 RepID=A0A6A3CYV6_HIBSY|nr:hypothetical protein F3Y22_tig00001120pilonHSYRG00373 [Hibiscus syriacus]